MKTITQSTNSIILHALKGILSLLVSLTATASVMLIDDSGDFYYDDDYFYNESSTVPSPEEDYFNFDEIMTINHYSKENLATPVNSRLNILKIETSLRNHEIFALRDFAFRLKIEGENIPEKVINKLNEYYALNEINQIDEDNISFLPLVNIDGAAFQTLETATFAQKSLPETYSYNNKKIIFQAAMETPLARVGGLGSFIRDYTKALEERNDIELFLLSPFFDFLKEEHFDAKFKGYIDHEVWNQRMRSTIYEIRQSGVTQYLIEPDPKCKKMFNILQADRVYSSYPHSELSARVLYFNSAVASMAASYRGRSGQGHVDILHTHTWHTLISAIILNDKLNPLRERNNLPPVRVLNTIHMHAKGEGFLPKESLRYVGIKEINKSSNYYKGIKSKGNLINIMETGASYADATNTVSPSLAEDMLNSELSLGVHETYRPLFQEN